MGVVTRMLFDYSNDEMRKDTLKKGFKYDETIRKTIEHRKYG